MNHRSVSQLAADLREQRVSSVELVEDRISAIRRHQPALNAFISVTHEQALAQARAADQRIARGDAGPMTGIPIAHKDIFCTKGVRTTCASRMLADWIAPYDATVVQKLAEAGAVMLGKTNMDEFAMGSSNENSHCGPVANPWDPARVPGGSSGGSAAAVAARLVPLATCTDTGGSIRQPAALCGITGIKPTYGRVSRYGMIAFASSLDQGGVMASSAEDAAVMLQAMAGFDPRDSTSVEREVEDYSAAINGTDVKGLRVGVVREHFGAGLDAAMGDAVLASITELERLGAIVSEVSLPNIALSIAAYYVIAPAECSSNLSRFDGVRFGHRAKGTRTLEEMYKRTRSEGFGAEVKRRIMIGTYALSAGYYDAYYLRAQRVRRLVADDFKRAFEKVDVLAGPTAPGVAFRLGEKTADPVQMYLSDVYTVPANLAGLPAVSAPCGFIDGLPVGLQLVGPHFGEGRLLGATHRLQQSTDWHLRRPPRIRRPREGVIDLEWETVIGLEIHAQLATRSKIFSGASTAYGAEPNTQACAIDLGLPGVLPVLNAAAVRMAAIFGLAVGGTVAARCVFARKNYFYPDLPKGYQISQFEQPIVSGGSVRIVTVASGEKVVRLTRAHLEEDAGKSLHEDFQGQSGIDLNRAGTPLLEIVSEPDMRCAEDAVTYMRSVHQLVRYLGICDGNMQEGSFRCDANVSIRQTGDDKLGTRTELKNLNSFRFIERAINFEVERQIELKSSGRAITQETRLYDPERDETRSLRGKEEANDYRYFPDPDLLPVEVTRTDLERWKAELPELPDARRARFERQYELPPADAIALTASRPLADYYEAAVSAAGGLAKPVANWVMGELAATLNRSEQDIENAPATAQMLGDLVRRIDDGTISGKIAKTVFEAVWNGEGGVDEIIEVRELRQVSDSSSLETLVESVIADHPSQVEQYRGGKAKLLGFFVGEVMKASQGKANPGEVNRLLKGRLTGG